MTELIQFGNLTIKASGKQAEMIKTIKGEMLNKTKDRKPDAKVILTRHGKHHEYNLYFKRRDPYGLRLSEVEKRSIRDKVKGINWAPLNRFRAQAWSHIKIHKLVGLFSEIMQEDIRRENELIITEGLMR